MVQCASSQSSYEWCYGMQLWDQENTWSLLEELHTFMNGHRRNGIFQRSQTDFQHNMQLKRVTTTRWNSTESAVETVFARFSAILSTLNELAESRCDSDSETVTAANGLHKRLKELLLAWRSSDWYTKLLVLHRDCYKEHINWFDVSCSSFRKFYWTVCEFQKWRWLLSRENSLWSISFV